MPKVIVYLRVEDARKIEEWGEDPATWVRDLVKRSLPTKVRTAASGQIEEVVVDGEIVGAGVAELHPVTPQSIKAPSVCGAVSPIASLMSCKLAAGHDGAHSYKL
jgi:hypothetical protein